MEFLWHLIWAQQCGKSSTSLGAQHKHYRSSCTYYLFTQISALSSTESFHSTFSCCVSFVVNDIANLSGWASVYKMLPLCWQLACEGFCAADLGKNRKNRRDWCSCPPFVCVWKWVCGVLPGQLHKRAFLFARPWSWVSSLFPLFFSLDTIQGTN